MTAPRVYFYCRDEETNLQEDVVALAEGLDALGIAHHASHNYWRRSTAPGDFLLRHDPAIGPDDCDIVVVSYTWPSWIRPRTYQVERRPLPDGLFRRGRRYHTVYMDGHDGYRTVSWEPEFRQFDLILRCKMNRRAWHPSNVQPWAYGLNQRILEATEDIAPFAQRTRNILINFGASHPYPHSTRDMAAARFEPRIGRALEIDRTKDDLSQEPSDPHDALMWRQTGHRFSRCYYERLKRSQAVACFCGDMIPAMPFKGADRYLAGGNRAKVRRKLFEGLNLFDLRPRRAVQWESFRFWETLAAGAVAINIDLERYGVDLPVMPTNWQHYVGIDFDRVDDAVDRIAAEPDLLARIAAEGRHWAVERYSPKASAERFLQRVHGLGPA